MTKRWVRPDGKYPRYYHTSRLCIAHLHGKGFGEVFSGEDAPAGVALCPDCEREMGSA